MNSDIDVLGQLDCSTPTDIIRLGRKEDQQLMALWEIPMKKNHEGKLGIPTDLFLCGTVPLMDCKITVDERDVDKNGGVLSFRVKIFEDYEARLAQCKKGTATMVGVIETYANDTGVVTCLGVGRENNIIGFLDSIHRCGKQWKPVSNIVELSVVRQLVFLCLETWYGVQIALLHPVVKEVFRAPRTAVEKTNPTKKSSPRKRKVKYVKEHVLNQEELDKLIYGERTTKQGRTRHALIWYVIGHWRTYANGKKVFVQPYWKGALKDTKLAETREREIITTT